MASSGSRQGAEIGSVYPSLAAAYPDLVLSGGGHERSEGGRHLLSWPCPTASRSTWRRELVGRSVRSIDLAADFRLRDLHIYAEWYGVAHQAPGADRAASLTGYPSCSETSWRSEAHRGSRLLPDGGVSRDRTIHEVRIGRARRHSRRCGEWCFGRRPLIDRSDSFRFRRRGLQRLRPPDPSPYSRDRTGGGASVLFTPHLAPMTRGILATCYMRPTGQRTARHDTERSSCLQRPMPGSLS